MDETLKKELFTAVDEAVKKNIEEIAGKEIADKVADQVKAMRLERALSDRDPSGLDQAEKKELASTLRAVAFGERSAYLANSDQAGSYLVPTEVYAGILRIAATTGLITRDARRWSMSTDELELPRDTGAVMQGAYYGEDSAIAEESGDLGVARLHAKTWGTIRRISNILLADANVEVADWVMSVAAEGLAYRIDREGFVGGTYAGSPFVGLLGSDQVTTQTLGSGKTGFEDFDPVEAAVAIASVPTAALTDAAFYFNPTVWAQLKGKRDGTSGHYDFSQDNSSLMSFKRENGIQPVGDIQGYPVYVTDVLPAYSTSGNSKKFGVFGNLKQALAWGDRGPMQIARSASAVVGGVSTFERNQTALRFTHRHAVAIQLPAAAVVLKTAGS